MKPEFGLSMCCAPSFAIDKIGFFFKKNKFIYFKQIFKFVFFFFKKKMKDCFARMEKLKKLLNDNVNIELSLAPDNPEVCLKNIKFEI